MKLRRTLLYVNGNDLERTQKGIASNTDCICFDVEDGVPLSQKEEARRTIVETLKTRDFRGKERMIRINSLDTPEAAKDLEALLPCMPDAIRLPKCETAEYVLRLDRILTEFEEKNRKPKNSIEILLLVETPLGVLNLYEMATCSKRVTACGVGMEDLTAAMGTKRYYDLDSHDLLYARQKIVLTCMAAGIQPLDACVLFNGDLEYISCESAISRRTGFVGRSVYDIGQIDVINKAFSPSAEDVRWARRVIDTYNREKDKGVAEIRLEGMYLDPPVLAKAEPILQMQKLIEARENGLSSLKECCR